MAWTVETLNPVVDQEIDALPVEMRARLVRLTELIEQVGFQALPRDTVKHLDRKTQKTPPNELKLARQRAKEVR